MATVGGNVDQAASDATLTAPLVLPATAGKPLTTQGGSTLDDGTGNEVVAGGFAVGGSPVLDANSIRGNSNSRLVIDSPVVPGGTVKVDATVPAVTIGHAGYNVPLQLDGASSLSSGTGAPGIAGAAGDFFFRSDTPSVALQRVYVCTVAGGVGLATWVGIL